MATPHCTSLSSGILESFFDAVRKALRLGFPPLQASKVESLLKATLPHLALDRKDQAAQGKTALPSDLQNLRHVEHLYGKYLQGIAAKSAQRPQSRQQPSSLASSQATEGFPGSQGLSKLPAQQAPAQSAASSRAPTPQPLEPASVQAPMPQLAAPAESSGEAPGKAAFDELDLTETSRPNAVAAALVSFFIDFCSTMVPALYMVLWEGLQITLLQLQASSPCTFSFVKCFPSILNA